MKTKLFLTMSLIAGLTRLAVAFEGEAVSVPAQVSHEAWDGLVKKYVDERGLVAYAAWKENEADLAILDAYLSQFAAKPATPATGQDEAASLINLYNASTIRWILTNYPSDSIMALDDSFGAKRHEIGGRKASLNDIEHGSARPLLGYRAHAVLVCAARSCPPLQRFAYSADNLESQIDTAYRAWLAREDLNRFMPEKKAEISSIFNWFNEDFEKAGGVKTILPKYAPQKYHDFLAGGDYEISYLPYNWGLNDQGAQGKSYSRLRLYWDQIVDKLRFWK
jgi:hypothetical protein